MVRGDWPGTFTGVVVVTVLALPVAALVVWALAPLATVDGDREDVRRAARRLAVAGRVRWTQKGRPVDPSTARGDVEITAT